MTSSRVIFCWFLLLGALARAHSSTYTQDSLIVAQILSKLGHSEIRVDSIVKIDSGRIVGVRLDNLGLTALPPEIGNLDRLTSLRFRRNKLTQLPLEILKLHRLASLDLINNPGLKLPDSIGILTQLRLLWVDSTSQTNLPASFWKLDLVSLGLSGNGTHFLPDSFGTFRNLQQLYIHGNGLREIPSSIFTLQQLEHLSLNSNEIELLSDSICNLRSLKSIDMNDNLLTTLPATFYLLDSLAYGFFNRNRISWLPQNIVQIPNNGPVLLISFVGNRLCNVPDAISGWLDMVHQGWRKVQNCDTVVTRRPSASNSGSSLSLQPVLLPSGKTHINCKMPNPGKLRVVAIDAKGRHVSVLYNGYCSTGRTNITLPSKFARGLYIIRAITDENAKSILLPVAR